MNENWRVHSCAFKKEFWAYMLRILTYQSLTDKLLKLFSSGRSHLPCSELHSESTTGDGRHMGGRSFPYKSSFLSTFSW